MGTASAGATPQPLHRLQPLLLASTEMTLVPGCDIREPESDLPSPDRAVGDARAGLPPPAPPDIRGHSSRASKLDPRPSKSMYLHPETVQCCVQGIGASDQMFPFPD